MNPGIWNSLYLLSLIVTGCGGGSDGGSSTPGSGTSYAFIVPVLDSTRTYAVTIVDNSSNTINIGATTTVTAVNSDGTYVILTQPANPTAIVNGTNYSDPSDDANLQRVRAGAYECLHEWRGLHLYLRPTWSRSELSRASGADLDS
jgi:hypothetical protein